jgi:hypothetical protein
LFIDYLLPFFKQSMGVRALENPLWIAIRRAVIVKSRLPTGFLLV